jgi:hypothetical protein
VIRVWSTAATSTRSHAGAIARALPPRPIGLTAPSRPAAADDVARNEPARTWTVTPPAASPVAVAERRMPRSSPSSIGVDGPLAWLGRPDHLAGAAPSPTAVPDGWRAARTRTGSRTRIALDALLRAFLGG